MYTNHYYSTVDKQLPVKFYEIEKTRPKTWNFDLNNYSTGPIDPSKFAPQCDLRCSGYCKGMTQDEGENLLTES